MQPAACGSRGLVGADLKLIITVVSHGATRGASSTLLETFHPRAGAVLILLSRTSTNTAGTYEHAATEDRHCTLAEKHMVALGHDNAAQRGMVGAWRQVAARTAEGGRRHGFALATVGTGPHCAVHPLKCHRPPASHTAMFIFAPISAAFAMAPAITRFASASVKVMLVTPFSLWQKVKGPTWPRHVYALTATKAEVCQG